jgi:Nucleotide modification associated domain 3
VNAILVRIAIDQEYGEWNAPIDPESGEFVYVPIPEKSRHKPRMERRYTEVLPALTSFALKCKLDLQTDLRFPHELPSRLMHLDPDFEWLTYGDNGDERGCGIKTLKEDDLLVFYAGLRSVRNDRSLVYGLVGLYSIDEVVMANTIPPERHNENAHTRKLQIGAPDIVVRAKPSVSGRLSRCIPVGEWRNGAYRVIAKTLGDWGDLAVKDGFIQRSVRPPMFLDPTKFYRWFEKQRVELLQKNN